MRVKYTETTVHVKYIDIPEEGLDGEELEEAAREIAFEAVVLGDWDEETVLENGFEAAPKKA